MNRSGATSRGVLLYLIGFFLTNVGVGGFTLAVGLTLYQRTGSATTFGLLVGVEYALGFVGQTVGGSILDRRSVLAVALTSNSIRGVAILLGGAFFALTQSQSGLIAVFLISAFIRPLYRAASFVMVRQVVAIEALPQTNALRFGLLQVAQLAGLSLVSGLFAVLPGGAVLCVVACFFLMGSAVHTLLRGVPAPAGPAGTSAAQDAPVPTTFLQNWRQLGQVLRGNPGLCVHIVVAVMPSVITSLATVLVAPVNQAMHGGPLGITVLDGGASLGSLATILVVRRLDSTRPWLIGLACGTATAALGLLAVAPTLAVAGLAFFLIGVATTIGATTADTLLQLRSAPNLLGRLSISRECAVSLTAVATIPLTGPLTAALGVHGTAAAFAFAALAYLLLILAAGAILRGRLFGQRAELPNASAAPLPLEVSA